jgi:1-acyl-sn-glycerol-3-phosphate acyltransferase
MNLGYFVVLFFYIFVTQIPCFMTLLTLYPIFLLTKVNGILMLPLFLIKEGMKWVDYMFFKTIYIWTEPVDKSKRYVYIGNHTSYVDPAVMSGIPHSIASILTSYAKYIPLIGPNAYMLGMPFVEDKPVNKIHLKLATVGAGGNGNSDDRDDSRSDSDNDSRLIDSITKRSTTQTKGNVTQLYIDYLKDDKNNNIVLAMFPTGKRVFDDENLITDIKTGAFVIAKEVGMDIIPVYQNVLTCFNDVTMEYHPYKKVYCLYGSPIRIEGKEIEHLKKEYHARLIELRDKCKSLEDKL